MVAGAFKLLPLRLVVMGPVLARTVAGPSAGVKRVLGQPRTREVIITIRVVTSMAEGAETSTGALISFEVGGAWLPYQELCGAVGLGETVNHSWSLPLWPSRLRLRAPTTSPPFTDAWGLQRIDVDEQEGRSFTVLEDCNRPNCKYSPTTLVRWVWSETEDNEYSVPALDSPEWFVSEWGPCCCPVANALALACTPGERTRAVSCSTGDMASCSSSGPMPVQVAVCHDYAACPYEPFCPLGRANNFGCDTQAWSLLGALWLLVVLGSLTCRHCRLRWFILCRQRCKSAKAMAPRAAPVPVNCEDTRVSHVGDDFRCVPQDGTMTPSEMLTPSCVDGRDCQLDIPRLLGTWCYEDARTTGRYSISRLYENKLRFDEQTVTGQWVFGTLEPEREWFIGQILMRGTAKEHGVVRLRYLQGRDCVLSNFQIPGESFWGQDVVACKAGHLPPLWRAGESDLASACSASDGLSFHNDGGACGSRKAVAPGNGKVVGVWEMLQESKAGSNACSSVSSRAASDSCCTREVKEFGSAPILRQVPHRMITQVEFSEREASTGTNDGIAPGNLASPVLVTKCKAPNLSCSGSDHTVPRVLHVTTPKELVACSGEYDLQVNERPNGQPLWKKRDGERWLYSGIDEKWYIGGPASRDKHFVCACGYIFRDKGHRGLSPDRVGGPWERGVDGALWEQDPSIIISSRPVHGEVPECTADQETVAAALELASDVLKGQRGFGEDLPGPYIVTHDNAAVTTGMLPSPPIIGRLKAGTRVQVREVANCTEDHRIRARIEAPAGWISLRDTKDGYRWAVPLPEANSDTCSSTTGGSDSKASSFC